MAKSSESKELAVSFQINALFPVVFFFKWLILLMKYESMCAYVKLHLTCWSLEKAKQKNKRRTREKEVLLS